MSIVNDALKKAGKDFEFKDQDRANLNQGAVPSSDRKWTAIITVSLVIVASLFGSLVLYKNMSRFNAGSVGDDSSKPDYAIQSTLNNIEQKSTPRALKSKDVVKLNGIVCGNEGKWAIVNNRIVKEGDSILGGEIISITKDIVKIAKKDGSEIILSLK